MPKNSRRVGAVFEREAAKLCTEYWHSPDAHRTAQRTGLGGTADVTGALDHGHVECKKRERMAVYNYLDQANRDKHEEQYPVLLLRANHRPTLVCFQIHDTEHFVADWLRNYKSAGTRSSAVEQAWNASQPGDGGDGLRGEQFDEYDQPVAKARPADRG